MTRRLLAALLFAVTALLAAGFVRLNAAPVSVELLFAVQPATLGEALVAAFVAGWLVALAGAFAFTRRLARERRRLARELKLAEGEARTLRATQPAHAR